VSLVLAALGNGAVAFGMLMLGLALGGLAGYGIYRLCLSLERLFAD
jgi:hypothetical protein